ncbi:preprotein translocase subunit YajC [Corynebacterium felinum]|uniref:Preprotein translocase subunit YajC n=1 Tax=Corynebacterium felinum TaxID=131318 RepID=A0ABU2BBQ2_9CORY|nr:preprotein translocase subunit YajC [Corynebacterium felinum]MDF5821393.1 preprotein translocase subunit YajC [Corynebacterium felinum]MDR7355806.1 preprotein translocase subunit YajC [Corynebacterium felinum]WJY95152.1 preprotein translocase subunit YajC [Corynebacterium felinum]
MDSIILLLLILAAVMVPNIMIQRKQRRRLAEIHQMQEDLKIGDQVVTTAGLYGVVTGIEETRVELEIAPQVRTWWERLAVVRNVTNEELKSTASVDDTQPTVE